MGVALTAWTSDVLRFVKGIDNQAYTDLLANEVLEVVRDFCRETDIWTVTLPAINAGIGVAKYSLAYPGIAVGSKVWRVEQVWFKANGAAADQYALLSPIVDWREDENGAYWRSDTAEAPTSYHHLVDQEKLLVTPIPTVVSTGGILVKASLIPSYAATEIVDFIYNRWKRGITHGIAAGLMRMSNKPWSDVKMAEYYEELYRNARENAMETKQRGMNRRPSSAAGAAVDRLGIGSRAKDNPYF